MWFIVSSPRTRQPLYASATDIRRLVLPLIEESMSNAARAVLVSVKEW